jgi:hypothetical protein
MQDPAKPQEDGKIDLVPMIDCIMLLLLFFILTTSFKPDDKAIAALLPTDQGQDKDPPKTKVIPPEEIRITVVPEGMRPGLTAAEYQAAIVRLQAGHPRAIPAVLVRVGGSEPLRLDGTLLSDPDTAKQQAELGRLAAHLAGELAAREVAGGREAQTAVIIHAFSGLPWKYALAALDGVRAYEALKAPPSKSAVLDPAQVRQLSFAPPRIRNYDVKELGIEMQELLSMH